MGRPAKALIVSSDPWVQIPPSPLRRTPATLLEYVAVDRNVPSRIASTNYMHVAWVTVVLRTRDERTRQYFSRIVERVNRCRRRYRASDLATRMTPDDH
jgi:hypothetical protein